MDDLTSEAKLKKANIFLPKQASGLTSRCRKVKGLKMSNTDNMRITAILSTMLVYHHYIEQDGIGDCDETPAKPVTIIDRVQPGSSGNELR